MSDVNCACCAGTGEHKDGHECYVCDASGLEEARNEEGQGQMCEGHHGVPDNGPENAKDRYGPDFEHYFLESDRVEGTFEHALNVMKASVLMADGYEGVTHAGIALVNGDEVFLAQRTMDETDDPAVQQAWEFPGGSLDPGEQPFEAALREFLEETGLSMPVDATVTNGWRSPDGVYQGFVMNCGDADMTDWHNTEWLPTSECQAVGWFTRETMPENLRPEVRDSTPWDLIFGVSGNEEDTMTASADEAPLPEPDYTDPEMFALDPLPIHGVVAPEEAATGDKRKFAAGAMTKRPLRLPFSDQKVAVGGHDGSVVVGSVDRLMRKDGLIHWEGSMMPSPEADDLAGRMEFFGGRFGVSVDGDSGNLDMDRSMAEQTAVFDQIRASGLTAVSIPAFHEAYVAFGPHPDMPADDATLAASMHEDGDLIGASTFKRGPGWVTDPKATNRIHDYWTKPGQPGYAKVAWGTPGDFTRAKRLIGAEIAKHSPDKMRFLNQIIAQWHFDALGYWPGDLGKPGNAPDTPANRRRAAIHASNESEETPDLFGDYEQAIEESDAILPDEAGQGWEAVLVSSAGGGRVTPPAFYFDRHPDTGATVIEEPDEQGIRRTYGYAGEWGICHIGIDGRCVEVPDPGEEYNFPYFHLGRTKTDGGYINTGVITYKVDHRGSQQILTETAEQQHFDNVAHAWAAVRLGTDDRGVWFSGYVLPTVPEEDIVLIEAAGQVSGEWKYGDLRALQAVNVPGFAVVRDDEGEVETLVASTFGNTTPSCEPTPAERMEALRMIDAEIRMDALRAEFNWVDVAENLMDEAQESGRVKPVGLRDDGAIVYEQDGEVPGTDTVVAPMPDGE